MARDPAVLFYTSDFLTGTSRLSDEQVGQYIRALCSQHQEGIFTKEELFQILKSYDSPVWKKFKQDSNGLYYNERMMEEIERRVSYCESKSHPGISGRKKKSYGNHTQIIRKSSANHTEDETRNDIKDIKEEGVQGEKVFDTFWSAYPKKVGKGAAEKIWNKIEAPEETIELILKALSWQKYSEQWIKDGGQYIPHPSTYLNQCRWMDEPPEVVGEERDDSFENWKKDYIAEEEERKKNADVH